MKIKTEISQTKNNEHSIRNIPLVELIKNNSFIEVVFLLLRGKMPTKNEEILLNALLVSAVEHGVEVPSLFVPRVSISTGATLEAAIASGILSIGSRHGGAGWETAKLLSTGGNAKDIVSQYVNKNPNVIGSETRKMTIPGFGHAIYKEADPRVAILEEMLLKLKLPKKHLELARDIEKELAKVKGKMIPLNIDGAYAACLLDLGFAPETALEFFILARIVGMSAHINEEMQQIKDENKPYYRLDSSSFNK